MYDDSVADYARITVIATGLTDNNLQNTPFGNRASNSVFGNTKNKPVISCGMNLNMLLQPADYEFHTVWNKGSYKHCSEKGHPDPGFS